MSTFKSESMASKAPLPRIFRNNEESIYRLSQKLSLDPAVSDVLFDTHTRQNLAGYASHIENMVGTAKIPMGVAGPIRILGQHAKGDYYVPMATSEGALIASYMRGMQLMTNAGGCRTAVLEDVMTRSPVFGFDSLPEALAFVEWLNVEAVLEDFRLIVANTSRHACFKGVDTLVHGRNVFLTFRYSTGDAAGQNMVTIATEAICKYMLKHLPIAPKYFHLEGNFSGDKKATARAFQQGRGKRVTAEVAIPKALFERTMGVTVEAEVAYVQRATMGALFSGMIGGQAHVSNALAAIYLACGQDIACVAESAVGVFTVEMEKNGDLYACLTLPNVIVGTVGGGSSLPAAAAALDILGLRGDNSALAFAEIIVGVALAGEVSIAAAMAGGYFSKAHAVFGRARQRQPNAVSSANVLAEDVLLQNVF